MGMEIPHLEIRVRVLIYYRFFFVERGFDSARGC
jgi:hypothetical protein